MEILGAKVTEEVPKDTNLKVREVKSPIGAMLRSFAIPGWGQVYVRQYWKAPLFFGGAAVMYYYTFKHNSDFLDYSRQYDELFKSNPQDTRLYLLKVRRENARDNRDISIFFLVAVYGLSMLDAYVDAHLFNFNVSEDLAFCLSPFQFGFKFSISIFRK
ncbi:MAG: DUF5683 domain-containing protein [Candidatus Kapaibacteriota bacterium]